MLGRFITSGYEDELEFDSLDIIGFQYNTFLNFKIKQVLKGYSSSDIGYSFPIETKSTISDILFVIGDKQIRPQLRMSEEASKEYQESKEKGYLSLLGRNSSGNGIIFNFGNSPDETKIEVHYTISYLAEVNNQGFFFRFPIASKYQHGYETSLPRSISFYLKIKTDKNISKIEANNSATINQFDNHNAFINLDKFEPAIFVQTLISDQDKSTAVSSDDYIVVSTYKEFSSKSNCYECKADYFFVIDRSASMEGDRIEKAVKCMRLMLQSLPMMCRFSIVCFGSEFQSLLPIVEYNNENVLLAMNLIKNINANMGGTDIYHPLEYIFSQNGMTKKIFLLTDGEDSNSEDIIRLVQENKQFGNIYTVGIGSGADSGLIRNLAEVTNGKWTYVLDNENFNEKLISLLSSSIESNSVDITIHANETIAETIPSNPYPLCSNISQNYFIKAPFCENVLISSEEFDLLVPVMKIENGIGMKSLFTKMIIHEYETYLRTHNDEAMKQKCIDLSISSGILCKYTHYIGSIPENVIQLINEFWKHQREICYYSRPSEKDYEKMQDIFVECHMTQSQAPIQEQNDIEIVDDRDEIEKQNINGSWDSFDAMDSEIKEKYGEKVAATVAAILYIMRNRKSQIDELSLVLKKAYFFLKKEVKDINWEEFIKNKL
ncbi:von Willebrand factor type A domain containing protein [Trichomonas vaginalis G3]|uniref:von Willebrand factor type A domain containing protein n=1 Tax=Trichomonas vaginalis (strain ATCC PRA-98 / G3) TaxID=412133 RepID=A2G772_TRIV3|nr:vault protein inter-alpha-trypsin domain-containing protein [Trichomonas vaginalis G3]EAX86999.1 von Willebrand factor type A domain containing protein [Trichomonas vaginalis G3]KAI5528445.1 vault protein inter-alpha-trypsin domain-containing protein [Trichomonas vaginalis G3]|eukprot:XP_001299929.1 von Willebrand factor type A domain containing protein [Trichomonas vaginalis G3]